MEDKLTQKNIDSPLEELSFDMRLYFYRELHQIRLRLIECSASGDLAGWFEMLEREYMQVMPHIEDSIEDKDYEKAFKLISNLLYGNTGKTEIEQRRSFRNQQIARAKLIEVEKKLNVAMQKKNMLLPTEKKRGKRINKALKI